jgi:hypothetical protein
MKLTGAGAIGASIAMATATLIAMTPSLAGGKDNAAQIVTISTAMDHGGIVVNAEPVMTAVKRECAGTAVLISIEFNQAEAPRRRLPASLAGITHGSPPAAPE